METIERLIEISNSIKNTYLYITKCELNNNVEEVSNMKEVVKVLIAKEDKILNDIINDKHLLLKLFSILEDSMEDFDIDCEIFRKNSNNSVVLTRLFNKLILKLTKANDEVLRRIGRCDKLLRYLDVDDSQIVNSVGFEYMISSVFSSTCSRLKINLLDDYVKSNDISRDDYISFTYYKNLSYFINPNTEYYYLNDLKLDNDIPKIIDKPDFKSFIHEDIYDNVVGERIGNEIAYLINSLLFGEVDYKRFLCSREVISTIRLLQLEMFLDFVDSDDGVLKIYKNMDDAIMGYYPMIFDLGNENMIDKISTIFNKKLKGKEKELFWR